MKKTSLLSLLVAGTLLGANDYKYEISPMIGYNVTEGNIGIKDDGHFTGGVELQYNYPNSKIAAELSVLYSPDANYIGNEDTSITRTLINGVYTFDALSNLTPFAKIGAGYEFVSNEVKNYNEDGLVLDVGTGFKVPLTENWALKAEAIYLAKVDNRHNRYSDNNFIGLVGLTYSFGAQKVQAVPEVVEVEEKEIVVIEKPKVDSDHDGVFDEMDKCPDTPAGVQVDAQGCKLFLDDDKDGVENSLDKCPNTPVGAAVNADGCPQTLNLSINFENNSHQVKEASLPKIEEFANFLKKYKNYTAEIMGYTDSRGSQTYNKKLSQKRADEVKKLLIEKGVEASRLTAIGMGELNPIASNETPEGRAKNRRIEANLTLN
ncbi:MAG TPA: cell envelope biogenesis protein OmpA [Sulfurimonas autotrophica]|nr:cell envelope biogenesis protein OmpA [Sulfurimonas autotrophica]